jgi:peptidoglycan/xylan/chitin deacetylase (PgdA/CDA1 family)
VEHLASNGYLVARWEDFAAGQSSNDTGLCVGLTFDDGHASDLSSAELLRSFGYDALFFIATEYIGAPGYVGRVEIKELRRLGMGIGSHAHHHVDLAPLTDQQIRTELTQSKKILEDVIGEPVEHVSFPGGSYNARVLDIARRVGYTCFYTTDWGVNTARQRSARVFRRTLMLNTFDNAAFDGLLRLRGYYTRQLGFHAKELAKRTLGVERYVRLRRSLMNLVR